MSLADSSIIKEPQHTADACIIWLHGLGADGHDFEPLVPQLADPRVANFRFILPHAPPRPITINGGMSMRAWYDIMELNRLEREDDAGIHASQALVDQLIAEQIAQGIPSQRILIAGFSQGGAIALQCGLRYPQPLGGIIALSTYLPLAHTVPAEVHASNRNIPIFLAHGSFDPLLPLRLNEATYSTLNKLGYHLENHHYPMAHSVCEDEIADLQAWLKQHLMPKESINTSSSSA